MGNRRKKIHGRANYANTQRGGGIEQRFGYAAQVRSQRFAVLPLEGKIRRNGLKEHTKTSRALARERAVNTFSVSVLIYASP